MSRKKKEYLRAARRETLIIIGLYALFFVWWYVTAYWLGDCDPSEYRYILGFPEWFFYSCIVGYIGISIILWIVIKMFFKELPPPDDTEDKK